MKKFVFILAPLLAITFLTNCNGGSKPATVTHWYEVNDWWNYCSNGKAEEQATASDIGREVNLTVNSQIHKVRLIGVDHDDLYNTSGKAHCTFEFSNLLSDSNGYSLVTLWESKDGLRSTNYDYRNSDIRKALDGSGAGTLRWYQKESETKSTDYTKPVIEMLPDGLRNNMKTVKKYVANGTSHDVKNYPTAVFVLTHNEMTTHNHEYAKEEGTTYQYYKDHDDNASRIKHQIKWHEGAVTSPIKITDIEWDVYNFAGYNDSSEQGDGGNYWLTSPEVNGINDGAWIINDGGSLFNNYCVYNVMLAVAPAFCI